MRVVRISFLAKKARPEYYRLLTTGKSVVE
jgi:hypothetical protein